MKGNQRREKYVVETDAVFAGKILQRNYVRALFFSQLIPLLSSRSLPCFPTRCVIRAWLMSSTGYSEHPPCCSVVAIRRGQSGRPWSAACARLCLDAPLPGVQAQGHPAGGDLVSGWAECSQSGTDRGVFLEGASHEHNTPEVGERR